MTAASTDAQSKAVMVRTAVIGAAITVGSVWFGGWSVVAGCAAGAAVAVANLWALRRLVARFLTGDGKGGAAGLFLLKMSILFGLLFVLVRFVALSPLAIAAGFSALVIAIGTASVLPPAPTEEAGEVMGAE